MSCKIFKNWIDYLQERYIVATLKKEAFLQQWRSKRNSEELRENLENSRTGSLEATQELARQNYMMRKKLGY